jgi:hypothetical protein
VAAHTGITSDDTTQLVAPSVVAAGGGVLVAFHTICGSGHVISPPPGMSRCTEQNNEGLGASSIVTLSGSDLVPSIAGSSGEKIAAVSGGASRGAGQLVALSPAP